MENYHDASKSLWHHFASLVPGYARAFTSKQRRYRRPNAKGATMTTRPATPLEPSAIASAEETIRRAMDKQAHNSATCPICRAKVIVWKRDGLKASLLRALAIANHVKTLHPTIAR